VWNNDVPLPGLQTDATATMERKRYDGLAAIRITGMITFCCFGMQTVNSNVRKRWLLFFLTALGEEFKGSELDNLRNKKNKNNMACK